MANGDMLNELQMILQGETPIPAKVTSRMTLAAVVELHRAVTNLTNNVQDTSGRVAALEAAKPNCEKCKAELRTEFETKEKNEHEKLVSWPWLNDKLATPVVQLVITIIVTAAINALLVKSMLAANAAPIP